MSAEMKRDPEENAASDSPTHHAVDGAIVQARSRLSLLKNHLANLSYDMFGSKDTEATGHGNKAINRPLEVQSSPRSSAFSGDLPLDNKGHERPVYPASSRGESAEMELQWRDSEAGTYSDDHEQFHLMQEIPESSSCSSRSWSVGKPIGFGVSASDQLLLRNLTRGSNRRRFDGAFTAELPVEPRSHSRRKEEDDTLGWILSSLLPYSCWPKEDAEGRGLQREGSLRRGGTGANKINQPVRLPLLGQAVRSAIGKLWDDHCLETAQEIWQLVTEFLSNEDEGRIDPEQCWVSGRAVSIAADGLPFAFMIHTFSSDCKPCTFGHANVLAEITSLTQSQERTGGHSSGPVYNESYSLPEPVSPRSRPWNPVPLVEGPSSPVKRSSTHPHKEAGSESLSTFSFNSHNHGAERGGARTGSASTETLSTADLTAFIRVGEDGSKPRHRGHLHARRHTDGDSPRHLPSGQDQDPQSGTFSEQDLIWEMQYPDYSKLETVVASRKLQMNDGRDVKRTYTGDTDSDEEEEEEKEQGEYGSGSPTHGRVELMHNDSRALVPYTRENKDIRAGPFESEFLDSDPWSDVATASSRNGNLTQSMEVHLGDEGEDDESGKKWGRIRKLSGLVRRVKKMIGNNVVDARKLIDPLPTIHDAQEPEESEGEELSGYYTCDTPSPTAMQRARSVTPTRDTGQREVFDLRSGSPDTSVVMPEDVESLHHDRNASVDSASGALSEHNLMLTPHSSLPSSHLETFQNVTWEESKSTKLPIKDLGNGQYMALGHLTGVGKYKLTVKIGKKEIQDGPKIITVVDPSTLGSGISDDGPFFQRAESPVRPGASTALSPHPDFRPCHSVSYDQDRLDYAQKHAHVGHVDLLFVVDCTSSMGVELRQLPDVVEKIDGLMKGVVLCKRLRMGVIAYRDHHPEDEDNFLLRKQDFTEDIERVRHFIGGLEADGGDDYPEAMEVALEEAAEGVRWSPSSVKFVVWVGDAPPHGYQGFQHGEAQNEGKKFKEAKSRLKKAAYAVDMAMMNEASPRQLSHHDRDLAEALAACDAIGKFHDKYPLGIPGRVRWEEAIERVAMVGARVIGLGMRTAVTHTSSSNCLRTIAHVSGGAFLEVSSLDASVIGPLTVAIVEQSLDQQLIEEEVCDLILCFRHDFEQQSLEDRRRNVIESMSQAAKQPHRLQIFPETSSRALADHGVSTSDVTSRGVLYSESRSTTAPSSSIGPFSISRGSFDFTASRDFAASGDARSDTSSLLLGMTALRFDDEVLDHVLVSLRKRAEKISRCLISNFESAEQWFEFHTRQSSDGLYRRERTHVAELTAPLSLRYIIATHIMAVDRP